jgi:WD40 repeat protein
MLLAVTPDGDVSLVSAVDGSERLSYSSGVKGFRPAVWADGQLVNVITAVDGKKGAYVINAAVGVTKNTPRLPLFDEVMTAAAVSKNKEFVAAGGEGGGVMVWKTKGNAAPFIFYGSGKGNKAFPARVDAMAFSDHVFPELLAASGTTVREWQSFGDWKLQGPRTLVADGPVFALLPVPRHRGVVAGVTTRGVAYWEAGSAAGTGASPAEGTIKTFTRAAVGAGTFDLDYAALGGDGKFGFWDAVRIKPITPEPDQPPAADLDFSKDGKLLAVAHADGSVGIWHAGERRGANTAPKQAIRITDHGGPVVATTWSPDGKELATVDKTGRVRVWADLKVEYPAGPPFEMKAP